MAFVETLLNIDGNYPVKWVSQSDRANLRGNVTPRIGRQDTLTLSHAPDFAQWYIKTLLKSFSQAAGHRAPSDGKGPDRMAEAFCRPIAKHHGCRGRGA